MKFYKSLFISNLFYYCLFAIAAIFVFSFFIKPIYPFAQFIFYGFLIWCGLDLLMLYGTKKGLKIKRNYPDRLSNGDDNDLSIKIENRYPISVNIRLIEELPIQLQIRDFKINKRLKSKRKEIFDFQIRPTKRGEYTFDNTNVFVKILGLFERRYKNTESKTLSCYPAFLMLKKYQLMATTNRLHELGVKRIRKIGSTLEFDTIKTYALGDEYRHINWKATGKAHKLMVNQYQDEKSQPIYSFIDTSRSMRMPFEEMTLLDYAINSSLVLSSISLLKQDKAGLLTFSNTIEKHIPADKRNHQIQLILDTLYKVKTDFKEAEYGKLYTYMKHHISQRSLIFLYSNFETLDALNRQMNYLQLMKKSHILVVIIFRNTELKDLAQETGKYSIDIYNQIIAEKFLNEKELIIQKLHQAGIQTIYTDPQNLTVNSINKYLEIKARGLI